MSALLCLIAVGLTRADAPVPIYYLLESVTSVNGRQVDASTALVKRTLAPSKGMIEERILNLRGNDPAQEIVTTLKITGNKAEIAGDGFSGTGTLVGKEWDWSEMTFTIQLAQPKMSIKAHDWFTKTGMSAEKQILGADGKPQAIIKEKGMVITEQTYDHLRKRLLPPVK